MTLSKNISLNMYTQSLIISERENKSGLAAVNGQFSLFVVAIFKKEKR